MRRIVDGAYLAAATLLAPLVVYRACRTGKYRADWDQRRGFLPELPPSDRRVWVHAVSVGEVNAAKGVIDAWRKQDPTLEIVVSTTTDTGLARARQIFPDLLVVRYPLDFSWFVARALERIKPKLIVLIELEVWYQFVTLAADRGIPVAVVNGRLSERSVRRFRMVRSIIRKMFQALAWVGAQDGVYAERFRYMGVPAESVNVTGSVKWDGADVTDRIAGSQELARAMSLHLDRPLWVAGSTGPGEEEAILAAYLSLREAHPDLQLAIVPRKPERFNEVAELIRKAGFTCVRRSERKDKAEAAGWRRTSQEAVDEAQRDQEGRLEARITRAEASAPATRRDAVILGDTMGELRKFYCLSSVVFVGRSLAAMGGSDAMEVAALAKPIVVGPHNENFKDTIARLQEARAVRILSADLKNDRAVAQLVDAVGGLLADRAAAEAMGRRAREVVLANRGATGRTMDALTEILNRAQHRAS